MKYISIYLLIFLLLSNITLFSQHNLKEKVFIEPFVELDVPDKFKTTGPFKNTFDKEESFSFRSKKEAKFSYINIRCSRLKLPLSQHQFDSILRNEDENWHPRISDSFQQTVKPVFVRYDNLIGSYATIWMKIPKNAHSCSFKGYKILENGYVEIDYFVF